MEFKLPESVTLVTGDEVKLAPIAWNSNLRRLIAAAKAHDEEACQAAIILVLRDCVRFANRDFTSEQLDELMEQLPLSFYAGLMASMVVKPPDKEVDVTTE